MSVVSLAEKLKDLLAEVNQSQAWLAKQAGVDSSVISRVMRGERGATPEVIISVAGVFGMDPAILVKGTDAESRFTESGEWVPKHAFVSLAQNLGAYEARLNESAEQLRTAKEMIARERTRRHELEAELSSAHFALQRSNDDLEDTRAHNNSLQSELRAHRHGLARAVAEVTSLKAQLNALATELSSTKQSARTSTILAGVAAAAGVVTAAHFLMQDDDTGDDEDEDLDDEDVDDEGLS